jgi:hypothetical protein
MQRTGIAPRGPEIAAALLLLSSAMALSAGVERVERVSVSSDGVQGNSGSIGASISADGRYVAFASLADNLVPGDSNGKADIFVAERSLYTP